MTPLYPFWCNNGGPLNRIIAVLLNSLLRKIKAQNFAWGVFSKQSFEIQRKNKSDLFIVVPL